MPQRDKEEGWYEWLVAGEAREGQRAMADIDAKIELINTGIKSLGFAWTRKGETPEDAAWAVLHDGYDLCDESLRDIAEVYIHLRNADKERRAPDLGVLKRLDDLEPECLKDDGCGGLEALAGAEELRSN